MDIEMKSRWCYIPQRTSVPIHICNRSPWNDYQPSQAYIFAGDMIVAQLRSNRKRVKKLFAIRKFTQIQGESLYGLLKLQSYQKNIVAILQWYQSGSSIYTVNNYIDLTLEQVSIAIRRPDIDITVSHFASIFGQVRCYS